MIGKPYALVLQHDRILREFFDVRDVLLTMEMRPRVRYIGLASNSSVGAEARYRSIGIPVRFRGVVVWVFNSFFVLGSHCSNQDAKWKTALPSSLLV